MKPIINRLITLAFFITLLGHPFAAHAALIQREGFAELSIRFCHHELVGYTKNISGDKSYDLVVYNSKNNQVAWRRKIDNWFIDARVTDAGALFLLDGHTLYQLNVFDGRTVNVIDLETLAWPPTKKPKELFVGQIQELEERLKVDELQEEDKQSLQNKLDELKRLSEKFGWKSIYAEVVLTPTTLFLSRQILRKTGCILERNSDDWIALDLATFKQQQAGTDDVFLGYAAPEEIFISKLLFPERLITINKGTIRDIGKILASDHPGWSLGSASRGSLEERSHDKRCLINFNQEIKKDNDAGKTDKEHYAVYDSRTGCFTYLDLEPITRYYTSLVLQRTNLVRYSHSAAVDGKTNSSPLWIESCDLTGKRIAKTTLSGTAQDRHLWFQGRTTKGDLIFTDYISYCGTGVEYPYTVTGGVVVVEIPSLKIKATHQLPDIQGGLDIKAVENTDQIVQVQGNRDLKTMKSESQPHQFIVRGMDVYSGKELWRFKEDVVIRKLKDE